VGAEAFAGAVGTEVLVAEGGVSDTTGGAEAHRVTKSSGSDRAAAGCAASGPEETEGAGTCALSTPARAAEEAALLAGVAIREAW